MDKVLVYFIITPLYIILGGLWISEAIRDYKRGSYFLFGTDLMITIMYICSIVKLAFLKGV